MENSGDMLSSLNRRELVKAGRRAHDPVMRSSHDPLWYRVLDRFGIPTLVAVTLLAALTWILQTDRADRLVDRDALYKVMGTYSEAVKEQTDAVKEQTHAINNLMRQIDDRLSEMRLRMETERERKEPRNAVRH